MAKKKETNSKSVALFDEDIKDNIISTKSKKTSKKLHKNESKDNGEALTEKTSKSLSTNKTVKKNESRKHADNSNNKSRNTVSTKSNNTKSSSKTKKKDSGQARAEPKRTSDIKQKSKTPKGTSSNVSDAANKKSVKALKDRYTDNTSIKSSEEKRNTGNRSRTKAEDISTGNKVAAGRKQKSPDPNEELLKNAKRNKHKHKQERTSYIQPPKPITGKPKVISDDLVAIIVDDEYLEVSPWSIKEGVYHQGLDSHFLVKYLTFAPVATKYDELDKKDREEFRKKKIYK